MIDRIPIEQAKTLQQPAFAITAAELMLRDFPDPRYVVPGYLCEGVTILAGRPKIGKSWLALGLALDIARGDSAFGAINCPVSDVLYLALEDNHRRLKSRMQRVLKGRGAPVGLTFCTQWPRLDQGGVEKLEEFLEANLDTGCIIIDTFAKVKPGKRRRVSSDMYGEDYQAVEPLHRIAHERGIAIILVHHHPTGHDPGLKS